MSRVAKGIFLISRNGARIFKQECLLMRLRLDELFLRWKSKLKVDLGELKDERESLAGFLRSKLKVDVTSSDNKVWVDSESLSAKELKRMVVKFVYHRNLMNEYWVSLKGSVVKINKFEHSGKKEERKKITPPSTIKHGW